MTQSVMNLGTRFGEGKMAFETTRLTYGEATPPSGKFASVSAGENYACGIQADGTIACWGDNTYGEATPPAGVFTSISAGVSTGCGVRADSTVACWGDNYLLNQANPPSGDFNSVTVPVYAYFIPSASFTASATPLSLATALTLALSAPLSDLKAPMYCP